MRSQGQRQSERRFEGTRAASDARMNAMREQDRGYRTSTRDVFPAMNTEMKSPEASKVSPVRMSV